MNDSIEVIPSSFEDDILQDGDDDNDDDDDDDDDDSDDDSYSHYGIETSILIQDSIIEVETEQNDNNSSNNNSNNSTTSTTKSAAEIFLSLDDMWVSVSYFILFTSFSNITNATMLG